MTPAETTIAITRLINLYCRHFDSGDSKGLASLWSEDGVLRIEGADAIVGRLDIGRWAETVSSPGRFAHMVTNIVVDEVNPNECTAHSYVAAFRPLVIAPGSLTPTALGAYDDVFTLHEGIWLFQTRLVTFSSRVAPLSTSHQTP